MKDWKLVFLVIGLQSCMFMYQYADGQVDIFTLCPSLMAGIQICADRYMPGKQTPIMAMFDPKAIGKIDLNLGIYQHMCSTMIDKMEGHFSCINRVLNTTTCPALGLELTDVLTPNTLDGMKKSWQYTCDHLDVLNSEAAQTCLIDTNKQLLRCITNRSREQKLKDALEDVNARNQKDAMKITNCIFYSLSAFCFKDALSVSGCPQNISEVSWESVKLVIPTACKSGPYSIYKNLFSGTKDDTSAAWKTAPSIVLPMFITLLTMISGFFYT